MWNTGSFYPEKLRIVDSHPLYQSGYKAAKSKSITGKVCSLGPFQMENIGHYQRLNNLSELSWNTKCERGIDDCILGVA